MGLLHTLETVCGWLYFFIWSATFYPQVALIFKRKNGSGFSTDYMTINIVGFLSYTVFTCSSYWIPQVKESYTEHTGYPPQVETNDVVFAIHGAMLCIVLLAELFYYPPRTSPKSYTLFPWLLLQILVLVGFFLCYSQALDWFVYLNFTGLVKTFSSLIKHFPQVMLNNHRKSTVGFSFSMVCLDVFGGLLSLLQQVIKSFRLHSLAPFTSNYSKTFLAIESLAFDFYFMVQHLIWYTDRHDFDTDLESNFTQQTSKVVGEKESLLETQQQQP